jgi:hypothetical protein
MNRLQITDEEKDQLISLIETSLVLNDDFETKEILQPKCFPNNFNNISMQFLLIRLKSL